MGQVFDRDTLQDEYEDALFRLVMAEYAKAEGESFLRENEELNQDPTNGPTPRQIRNFKHMMNKSLRKRTVKHAMRTSRRVFGRVAAIIVCIFAAFSALTLSVEAVRVNVFNFLIDIGEQFTSIKIENSADGDPGGENMYVTWKNAYAPTYIPEGFKIAKIYDEPDYKSISYMNEEEQTLFYQELSESNEGNIDTEDADRIQTTSVQGCEALLVEKNGRFKLLWVMDSRIFLIIGTIPEDDIFKIAESVKFIH